MAEPNHCQQERVIAGITSQVSGVQEDVGEVKDAFKDMLREFRDLTKDLRDSLLDGRQLKTEVATLRRDLDFAFKDIRNIKKDDIKPLNTFREKTEAKFASVKIIPVLCAVVVSVLTIYNFTSDHQHDHQAVMQPSRGPVRAVAP